ncbi:sugar transferase [Pedobacter ginsengiterrae]|uniref:sugar transferase n=1 Tax=Pedobacter ginsengiterrae TaxID=871696 RepID=UPI003CD059E3
MSFQKRIFDIVLSAISLFLLAPIFIIVAVTIKLESNEKAINKSRRVGVDEKFLIFVNLDPSVCMQT